MHIQLLLGTLGMFNILEVTNLLNSNNACKNCISGLPKQEFNKITTCTSKLLQILQSSTLLKTKCRISHIGNDFWYCEISFSGKKLYISYFTEQVSDPFLAPVKNVIHSLWHNFVTILAGLKDQNSLHTLMQVSTKICKNVRGYKALPEQSGQAGALWSWLRYKGVKKGLGSTLEHYTTALNPVSIRGANQWNVKNAEPRTQQGKCHAGEKTLYSVHDQTAPPET